MRPVVGTSLRLQTRQVVGSNPTRFENKTEQCILTLGSQGSSAYPDMCRIMREATNKHISFNIFL